MGSSILNRRLCLLAVFSLSLISSLLCERVEILMNNVTTQKDDAYICTSYKLTENQKYISK